MPLFPEELDTAEGLHEVHDSLRVKLAEDYVPGDSTITVSGDEETMSRFPSSGVITLTEQCSDAEERAICLRYTGKTATTFTGCTLVTGFPSVGKPKIVTNVTQNVLAEHHNDIKDAVIAIQQYVGKKGEISTRPQEGTMEARTNYIRKLALTPKAWFEVNKTIGLVPLTVEFTDRSFRLATDGVGSRMKWTWDFGDNAGPSITTITDTDGPVTSSNVIVEDLDGGSILKEYTRPGIYDVTLTVENEFGSDTVTLPGVVNARIQAPDEAIIQFNPRSGQIFTAGSPPKIRSAANVLIDIEIPQGKNTETGKSYAGEVLDGSDTPLDPIAAYTWSLADDLEHSNGTTTRASYSIGGVYDLILRVDTEFGAYRITTYEDCIDIVEKDNLWLWNFSNANSVNAYEFGLISETFKSAATNSLTVGYDDSFLDGVNNEEQQKREFRRNNGFAQRGLTSSGNGGAGLLYWASGRGSGDPISAEKIMISEYNGFADIYTSRTPITRPWNWLSLASLDDVYFAFGGTTTAPSSNESPTNQTKDTVSLSNLSVTSATFSDSDYKNGADELKENVVTFDDDGNPNQGHMSIYRTAWKDNTGYILRNAGVGDFFRIRSFYKTSGNSSEPFLQIKKLLDMGGPAKLEGRLLTLNSGVYFFNNTGAVSAYNATSLVWETNNTAVNSASFRGLQDSSVIGFDEPSNTLVAASDGERVAYLSFDYSPNAFIKFNETTTTFTKMGARPDGVQWQAAIF